MNTLTTVILAAGFGTRMRSKLPKVLHPIGGAPMLAHVIDLAKAIGSDDIICVVGHHKESVMAAVADPRVRFIEQTEQLGTGHAVQVAMPEIQTDRVLVLYGDTPLLLERCISDFLMACQEGAYDAGVISTEPPSPEGYGRIVRDAEGRFRSIVENRDLAPSQRGISEINSGIGLFSTSFLKTALARLTNDNAQGEYYLTDVFSLIMADGGKVEAFSFPEYHVFMGINDRVALAEADAFYQRRLKQALMQAGVTFIAPETSYVERGVSIGADTVIYPGCVLSGRTHIGSDCIIGPGADLTHVRVANGAVVKRSTLVDAEVGEQSQVGPYAYIRPNSHIGAHVKIGDFVEIKNSTVGDHTKISHLTYVGDGHVGERVNIGCGVVFVNYDGAEKHLTDVGNDVFIGCNSNLISPVRIGDGAYIAAGSTITEDVPDQALAVARARQINKQNWVNKYQKK